MRKRTTQEYALNAVCPYYTMFPLDFPLGLLRNRRRGDRWVLDPFCGRGTTNFAARLSTLHSVGIDSSPVAAAIAEAKLACSTPEEVVRTAQSLLANGTGVLAVPTDPFWEYAYHPDTLRELCSLRHALMVDCSSDTRALLRAILMGALHGPLGAREHGYLSNQCPRTFAPKPRYALAYWKRRRMYPPRVSVMDVIRHRAHRYLAVAPRAKGGFVVLGDSRDASSFRGGPDFSWVITSPPYYGMRTYVPDQWLRNWFVGGPSHVDYTLAGQLSHAGPEAFVADLRSVWRHSASTSKSDAQLVCRFGGISTRNADPLTLAKESFRDSGWKLTTARRAGTALDGRRQSYQFATRESQPRQEYDLYARRD